jgi:uncharacterized protein (TIGR00303 family)
MDLTTVHNLFKQGLLWGDRLADKNKSGYLILSECVVGGTTTALAILTGLGINARGKVNSSHPVCNHEQKWRVVQQGLGKMDKGDKGDKGLPDSAVIDPLELVAAVGDPMQVVVAGMTIAASHRCGVMLAGGTQMLAVYALINAIAQTYRLSWQPTAVVVGTTRWVAEDPTGDTVNLALSLGKNTTYPNSQTPPLLATSLSFANSSYPQLQAYERGFVKEGVGAGAACIAANLSQNWQEQQLLAAIEVQIQQLNHMNCQNS